MIVSTSADGLVDVGPALRVAWFRVIVLLAGALAALVVGAQPAPSAIILVLAATAAIVPASRCAWFCAAVILFALALGPLDPVRTAVAALTLHLLHVGGVLTMTTAPAARMTAGALRLIGLRFLQVQVPTQIVVWALALVPVIRTTDGVPVAAVLAALLVLGAALTFSAWMRRLDH